MNAVEHIIFLIHPCIYEGMDAEQIRAGNCSLFLAREQEVKKRWLEALALRPTNTLFVQLGGPDALREAAARHLGTARAISLRSPFPESEDLREYYRLLTAELHEHLRGQNLVLDPASASSELWGESFEGCVPGYGGAFAEHLGLRNPPQMRFEMTVFDARFIDGAAGHEVIPVPDSDVEAWLFACRDTTSAATFQPRLHAQWLDRRRIALMLDDRRVQVCTTNGHTVWPDAPWKKGKREQVLAFAMALSDFCFHWVRGVGLAHDDFRQVIAAARIIDAGIAGTGT